MRKSTVILTGGLFLFSSASLWLLMRLNEERARTAELQAQTGSLRSRETPPGQPIRPVTTLTAPASSPGAAHNPDSVRLVKKPASAEDWRARERQMLHDPRYREALKAQRRLELKGWREEIMRLLGLTADQADQVLDIHIEREIDESVLPIPQNEAEMKQRMRDIKNSRYERDDAVAAILGDAKAAQWQQYLASQPSRAEVRQLGAQLLSTANPLRDDQVEPLVAALATEREQFMNEINDYYVSLDWDESNKADSTAQYSTFIHERATAADDRARLAAAGVLSQSQLNAFIAMQRHRDDMDQARQRMLNTRSQANQASAAKPD